MRKNKGDVTFYLEEDNGIYHLIKKKKTYIKALTKGKTKTTKQIMSNFYFNNENFNNIDFSANGLRETDKEIILQMIEEMKKDKNLDI